MPDDGKYDRHCDYDENNEHREDYYDDEFVDI